MKCVSLLVLLWSVSYALAEKPKPMDKPKDKSCSLTFKVSADEMTGLCHNQQVPQGIVMQEVQVLKAENAALKKELDDMRAEYKSMVESVKTLEEDTRSWREIIEWPQRDAIFKPDNETLYINPDGPSYPDCEKAVSATHKQGIYLIEPTGASFPFLAYCDEEGWTVIHRRFDGSENFYREWADYMKGFGKLSGEYWLGLENIHLISNQGQYDAKVEVLGYNDKLYHSLNPGFKLGDESTDYMLHVGNQTEGNHKDHLAELDGLSFTTSDKDNDEWSDNNCAYYYRGAFWLQDCGFDLHRDFCDGRGCMAWGDVVAHKSLIKIRPSGSSAAPSARKPKKNKKPSRG